MTHRREGRALFCGITLVVHSEQTRDRKIFSGRSLFRRSYRTSSTLLVQSPPDYSLIGEPNECLLSASSRQPYGLVWSAKVQPPKAYSNSEMLYLASLLSYISENGMTDYVQIICVIRMLGWVSYELSRLGLLMLRESKHVEQRIKRMLE